METRYSSFNLNNKDVQELYYSFINPTDNIEIINQSEIATLNLPSTFTKIIYFESGWGKEITKQIVNLETTFKFKNEKGRSSGESATFFSIYDTQSNKKIDFAICISSNFEVSLTKTDDFVQVTVNYPDPNFELTVPPFQTLEFPKVLAHVYETQEACFSVKHNYNKKTLKPEFSSDLNVVYNHWWAYEDRHINEDVILENAKRAKEIGCELLVLDAGWFGNDSDEEEWFTVRGDWKSENKVRFPSGIAKLGDKIREMGLEFGIWCEIEGLGINANLAKEKPHFIANREGENLGYVCFGQKEAQTWALEILTDLISKTKSTYMKLDFNLDPGLGCNDLSHDHKNHNGLWAHYKGLYDVLDELKARFPNLIIENCSSGGQRFDLEMMKHTDVMFLSDPDYSSHQLRIFKEVSKWLLPTQLLHFMWSNTVTTNGSAPFKNLNLDELSLNEIKYHIRLAMMHHFGISHRLTDYNQSTLDYLKNEIALYKNDMRQFIKDGQFMILNEADDAFVVQYELNSELLIMILSTKEQQIKVESPNLNRLQTFKVFDLDLQKNMNTSLTFNFEAGLQSKCLIIKK